MPPRLYSAFGLTMASDFRFDTLRERPPGAGSADLRVQRAKGLCRARHPGGDPFFDITPERQYLHWRAVGAFAIDDPGTVRIDPHDDVCDHLISQAFLGLVMSLVLERRGVLSLHASAVSIAGRAAIFLGDKGAGKSTTCGALLQRGHLPLTDDLVAVDGAGRDQGPPRVRPGFSSMKLWPDSVAALALDHEASDRLVHPSVTKVQKRMPAPMAPAPVAMGALFVLRRSRDHRKVTAEPLPPHAALQAVLRYTFMARYGETRLGRAHLAGHLKRCGGIVAQVPVYDLHIPEDLSRLPDLADAIDRAMNVAISVQS